MRSDFYTKFVLTIIAICLTIIVIKDVEFIPKLHAEPQPVKALNGNYGLVPINADGSINVKLVNEEVIDVQIRGIDESPYLRWEAIKVEVDN